MNRDEYKSFLPSMKKRPHFLIWEAKAHTQILEH
jgi:hypothetical protein